MDIIVPAGIRLDLDDEKLVLPNEVKIHLSGCRPLYEFTMQSIAILERHVVLPVGRSI